MNQSTPRNLAQGQGVATLDKERRVASALSIGMRVANAKFAGGPFRFWHFDANAGSGWNDLVDAPGSPLAFHAMADQYLPKMRRAAFFCDIREDAVEELRCRLHETPKHAATSVLLCEDNHSGVEKFAEAIERRENPKFAVGSLLIDPNGYWYRNRHGIGAPVQAVTAFAQKFPRIDVILNLNIRTYWMQKERGHSVISPTDVLASLGKSHWLVGHADYGSSKWLLAIGRNTKTSDHRALGLHDINSREGKDIMNRTLEKAARLRAADPQMEMFAHV